MPKSIKDNLISQLGLDGLPQEKKIELMMKWGDIVQKDIIIRVLRELSEEDKAEMDKLLASQGENFEEIYKFLDIPYLEIKNIKNPNPGKYYDMDEKVRNFLIEYFRTYNQSLYAYLDIDFEWDT